MCQASQVELHSTALKNDEAQMIQPSNSDISSSSSRTKTSTFALRNLIYYKQWEEVESACKRSPYQARVADRTGDLLLHEACISGAPFQVIKNLITAYPAGVKKKGFCGRLPLHYASYKKPSLHTIKILLKNYPEGVSEVDSDGRLPIHLAVVRNAPKEVILMLSNAYPKSLCIPNKFGSTPPMLARNVHMHHLLQEEEDRLGNISQKVDAMKKLIAAKGAPFKMSMLKKFSNLPKTSTRNDEIQYTPLREKPESTQESRMHNIMKKLDMLWPSPSGIVSKDGKHTRGYSEKSYTIGHVDSNKSIYTRSLPDKCLSNNFDIYADDQQPEETEEIHPTIEERLMRKNLSLREANKSTHTRSPPDKSLSDCTNIYTDNQQKKETKEICSMVKKRDRRRTPSPCEINSEFIQLSMQSGFRTSNCTNIPIRHQQNTKAVDISSPRKVFESIQLNNEGRRMVQIPSPRGVFETVQLSTHSSTRSPASQNGPLSTYFRNKVFHTNEDFSRSYTQSTEVEQSLFV